LEDEVTMPQDEELVYGPKAGVEEIPTMQVSVIRTYGGKVRQPVLWRGVLAIFFLDRVVFELEAVLLMSKQEGGPPYLQWGQRQYTDAQGVTKYKNTVWSPVQEVAVAAAEAIRLAQEGEQA
jgi:hypothetical protein